MQKLAVVYFPKINLEKVNSFREKYDLNWHLIPPHITIVSPLSGITESQLIEHIEKVTKDIEYFSVHLRGLAKTFDDYLFLQVKKGNDEIVNMHNKLYSGILTSYIPTDFTFAPHVTLGFFRTKDDKFDDKLFAKAFAEAQELNFDITCDFDTISIIEGDGVSPARIIKTIKLHS